MTNSSKRTPVYLEIGKKRVLAGALDWPGWCRGGRDGGNALLALLEYAPRYERVLQAAGILFDAPADMHALEVAERLEGNPTTDFGAPDIAPSADASPIDDAGLKRLQDLLKACWAALDVAVEAARGKELRKGPRGGGRELDGILEHVLGAEASYVSRLSGKLPAWSGGKAPDESDRRQAILDALAAAARGELPERGPRGGARWTPRFFVRRAAWHILDHVWEIEDRVL